MRKVEGAIEYNYENFSITVNSSKTIYCSLYYDVDDTFVKDLSGSGHNGKTYNIAKWDSEGITTSDENTNGYVDCGLGNYDFKDSISLVLKVKINKFTTNIHQRLFNNYGGSSGTGLAIQSSNSMYKPYISS